VREIFCQRGVTLVFLNACQTGSGGLADFNKGVAQSLVSHGLPALVANQYSVLDTSATHFAQHFYWSLAQGLTIGQAAREARIAVNYSLEGEVIDPESDRSATVQLRCKFR
jgi:CHAT domain-containing protein